MWIRYFVDGKIECVQQSYKSNIYVVFHAAEKN